MTGDNRIVLPQTVLNICRRISNNAIDLPPICRYRLMVQPSNANNGVYCMKSKHPILISLAALTVVLAILALSTLRSTHSSSPIASLQHAASQSINESDTYAVTRPVRETHKKDVSYTVMTPVRENRTKTVSYTVMNSVCEDRTKIDPITGDEITYTVARHVPEQREKAIHYVVTTMVPKQHHKTVEYQTVRFETSQVTR